MELDIVVETNYFIVDAVFCSQLLELQQRKKKMMLLLS